MPFSLEHRRVHLVVGVARVAAVDHDVAGLQQRAEVADGGPGRLPGGHHDPDHPRLAELLDQLLEAGHVPRGGLVAVVPDDRVTGAAQPLGHVAAHLAEPDETDLHRDLPKPTFAGPSRPAAEAAANQPGQANRHDQVAEVGAAVAVDRGDHRRLARRGERHPGDPGVHRRQPVEQERRVEGDGQRLAAELGLDLLLGPALVVAAGGQAERRPRRSRAAPGCRDRRPGRPA